MKGVFVYLLWALFGQIGGVSCIYYGIENDIGWVRNLGWLVSGLACTLSFVAGTVFGAKQRRKDDLHVEAATLLYKIAKSPNLADSPEVRKQARRKIRKALLEQGIEPPEGDGA